MSQSDLLITIRRGTDPDVAPILITAERRVVEAVIAALVDVLEGPTRGRVLALRRDDQREGGEGP